jgi:hypothetical protein
MHVARTLMLVALGLVAALAAHCAIDWDPDINRNQIDGCPDVCGALCAGLPEPEVPEGCPIPTCDCTVDCPDVCGAICAGLPEPEVPNGCGMPGCACPEDPECPDVCAAICAGEPEPEVPSGCPIPTCACPDIPASPRND